MRFSFICLLCGGLTACVDPGPAYEPYQYHPAPSMEEKVIENNSIFSILATWSPASEKYQLLQTFTQPSDRFAMAMGYAKASASDIFSTWTVVSGFKYEKQKAEKALIELQNIFSDEDDIVRLIFPIENTEMHEMVQMLNSMTAISPVLFAQNMYRVDAKFEVHSEKLQYRNLEKLKQDVHAAFEKGPGQQSACYILGSIVVEREKLHLSTESYWQICGTGETSKETFTEFLRTEGFN